MKAPFCLRAADFLLVVFGGNAKRSDLHRITQSHLNTELRAIAEAEGLFRSLRFILWQMDIADLDFERLKQAVGLRTHFEKCTVG